jgi:hypothetical protein
VPARVAQDEAVAGFDGQGVVQGEPGHRAAEGAYPGRDGCGAEVGHQLARQVGDVVRVAAVRADPDVQDLRGRRGSAARGP